MSIAKKSFSIKVFRASSTLHITKNRRLKIIKDVQVNVNEFSAWLNDLLEDSYQPFNNHRFYQ